MPKTAPMTPELPPDRLPSVDELRYKPIAGKGNCPGTTKAGTRCCRTVVMSNGRCSNHGGENSHEQITAMLAALQARAALKRERLARKQRRALRRAKKRAREMG